MNLKRKKEKKEKKVKIRKCNTKKNKSIEKDGNEGWSLENMELTLNDSIPADELNSE